MSKWADWVIFPKIISISVKRIELGNYYKVLISIFIIIIKYQCLYLTNSLVYFIFHFIVFVIKHFSDCIYYNFYVFLNKLSQSITLIMYRLINNSMKKTDFIIPSSNVPAEFIFNFDFQVAFRKGLYCH